MNYIYIDTETGDFGILHSRAQVTQVTNRLVKHTTLENLMSRKTKSRTEFEKSYIDERFIILPVKKISGKAIILYNDDKLKYRISCNSGKIEIERQ